MSQMLGHGPGGGSPYHEAARVMAKKIAEAGGSAEAANAILGEIKVWERPVSPPRLLGRTCAQLECGKPAVELETADAAAATTAGLRAAH